MPNHITNRIQMFGTDEQIKEILDKYSTFYPETQTTTYGGDITFKHEKLNEYGWFNEKTNTFSRRGKDGLYEVKGIPKGFKPLMDEEFTRFPDFNKVLPMPKAVEASLDTGGSDPLWYQWCPENWGTKWNSYSHRKEDDNTYVFETAWAGVPKILEEISLNFPDVEIQYEWADEDTSYNTGTMQLKNGIIDLNQPDGGSKEAYELYFKLCPEDKQYYKLVDGNYTYDEDTEFE